MQAQSFTFILLLKHLSDDENKDDDFTHMAFHIFGCIKIPTPCQSYDDNVSRTIRKLRSKEDGSYILGKVFIYINTAHTKKRDVRNECKY